MECTCAYSLSHKDEKLGWKEMVFAFSRKLSLNFYTKDLKIYTKITKTFAEARNFSQKWANLYFPWRMLHRKNWKLSPISKQPGYLCKNLQDVKCWQILRLLTFARKVSWKMGNGYFVSNLIAYSSFIIIWGVVCFRCLVLCIFNDGIPGPTHSYINTRQ